jgi:hypothetical protein
MDNSMIERITWGFNRLGAEASFIAFMLILIGLLILLNLILGKFPINPQGLNHSLLNCTMNGTTRCVA